MAKKSVKKDSSFVPKKKTSGKAFVAISYVPKWRLIRALNDHSDLIRGFAYIWHDQFSDFELKNSDHKSPHWHVLILTYRDLSYKQIERFFWYIDDAGCVVNTFAQVCTDPGAYYDYMWHNPAHYSNRFTFSEKEITCSDLSLFKVDILSNADSLTLATFDMLKGVPVFTLVSRYGRDFIVHYHQILDVCNHIKAEHQTNLETELFNCGLSPCQGLDK